MLSAALLRVHTDFRECRKVLEFGKPPFMALEVLVSSKLAQYLKVQEFEKSPFMALKVQNHYKVGRVLAGTLEQGCGPLLECLNNNAAPSIQLLCQ